MNFDELDKVEIALIWLMVAVAVMGFIVVGVKIYDTVWGNSEDSTEKVVVTIEVTDEQYEKFIDIYKDDRR
jgi:ABC-type cobalt transport system substrate-binding protein